MRKCFNTIYCRLGQRSSLKWPCLAVVLGAGIIAPLARGTTAHAAIPCKSDPVLVVNGAVVDVVSTLSTDPSAVRELDYHVTVPSGSVINKTTLTVGLGFPEHVNYVFSPTQPWGSIQVTASVVTQDGVAPFPVSVQVSSLLAGSDTASGTSADTLTVALDHVLMV